MSVSPNRLVLAVLLLPLVSCGARSIQIGEGDIGTEPDPDADYDPCDSTLDIPLWDGTDAVDLLVLVDNSNSMSEEQEQLTASFPLVLETLTTPAVGAAALVSLHVGVISSDMGTSGYPIVTCSDAAAGDDGVLQHDPSTDDALLCKDTYPTYLAFEAENPDATIGDDFSCIARLGTSGCGFEQQLFAVEKALTLHSQPGAANDGFLREDAVLAILLVTDEEDCSIADATFFSDDDSLGHLNIRCFQNPEMVRPVEGFVERILAVKPGRPDKVVVAGIVGVPEDLVQISEAQLRSYDLQSSTDFQRILNDGRMQEQVDFSDEGGGRRLVPS